MDVRIPYSEDGNLGAAYNKAMETVKGWVLFIDHDVFLRCNPRWHEICLETIKKLGHNAGFITCVTNRISRLTEAQHRPPTIDSDDLMDHFRIARDVWLQHGFSVKEIAPEIKSFSGFFILTHKKAWEDVGGFCDGFLGVDNDYSDKIDAAGYKRYVMNGLYVYHAYRAKDKITGYGEVARVAKDWKDKIPVLFTTFNRLAYTKQALPVLIENTPEGRIVVIDNGSTDGTVEYLESFNGDIDLILNTANTGLSGAMNTFFDMTQNADYVAKVDNDTLVPAGWLSDLCAVLEKGNIEIVQAAHNFFNSSYNSWEKLKNNHPVKTIDNGNLFYTKHVGGSGIVFKRNIITEPLENVGLSGWGNFQHYNKQHRRAMFDGVWIDLLDTIGINQYSEDIDRNYFLSTGRFERQ